MGPQTRSMSVMVAANKFKMPVRELRRLIAAGECSPGGAPDTVLVRFDTQTKGFALLRRAAPAAASAPAPAPTAPPAPPAPASRPNRK